MDLLSSHVPNDSGVILVTITDWFTQATGKSGTNYDRRSQWIMANEAKDAEIHLC